MATPHVARSVQHNGDNDGLEPKRLANTWTRHGRAGKNMRGQASERAVHLNPKLFVQGSNRPEKKTWLQLLIQGLSTQNHIKHMETSNAGRHGHGN